MQLWRSGPHPKGVSALEKKYTEFLNDYRIALGVWTEVRALYSPDAPEITAATDHLEAIEKQLGTFSEPALAA